MLTFYLISALPTLLFLSGFFSGSEIGLLSCSSIKVRNLANKQEVGIHKLENLLQDKKKAVILILVLTNITNTTYTLVGETLIHRIAESLTGLHEVSLGVLVSTLILTPPLVIFGEIFPKSLFRHYSFTLTKTVAPLLYRLKSLFSPFLLFFYSPKSEESQRRLNQLNFTKDSLFHLIESGIETGNLMNLQEKLIRHILSLEDSPLGYYSAPLPEQPMLSANMRGKQALQFIRDSNCSSPFFIQRKGKIIGYVTLKELWRMKENSKLENNCVALPKLALKDSGLKGLSHLLVTKTRFALVTEGKRVAGFFSLKDLLSPGL